MSWPWLLFVYVSVVMALVLFYYCIGASNFIVNMWGLRMTSAGDVADSLRELAVDCADVDNRT